MLGRPASSLLHALIVTVALLPFGGVSTYWHTISADGSSRMQGPTPLVLEPNARLTAAVLGERRVTHYPPAALQASAMTSFAAEPRLNRHALTEVAAKRDVALVVLGRLQLEGG
jgi:hypothetical protein